MWTPGMVIPSDEGGGWTFTIVNENGRVVDMVMFTHDSAFDAKNFMRALVKFINSIDSHEAILASTEGEKGGK